jgi:hypothetical protein
MIQQLCCYCYMSLVLASLSLLIKERLMRLSCVLALEF